MASNSSIRLTLIHVPLSLAIVNDYEVVVRGLAAMLRSYGDRVQVVELAASTTVSGRVDIALYDTFAQSPRDRDRVGRLVRDPSIGKVVVYSWHTDDSLTRLGPELGVAGFISKSLAASELVDALEEIHQDRAYHPVEKGRGSPVGGDWPGREEGLTARESEILSLITQGLSNADIVESTGLSINSIKSYIRSAYRKIDVTTRSRAILWGIDHGFQPDRVRVERPDIPGQH